MTASLAESFREELVTLLEALEASLLALDERPEQEQLDEVFRAAHNIKSATAMMGLRAAAETAHDLETKLDEMRSGRRAVDRTAVTRLLDELDRLRAQVRSPAAGSTAVEDAAPPAAATRRFRVVLSFAKDAPHVALDPVALLFAIADFGVVVSSRTDDARLPSLEALDPEAMHLRFELVLEASVTLDDLRSAFLFAEDRIELELEELPADGRVASRERADNAGEGRRPESETIVVGVRRVDALVDLAAELAIATTRLEQLRVQGVAMSDGRIEAACGELRRLSSRVQEAAMSMRLVPMASTFALLRRYVRDQSIRLGKDVVVDVRGAQTELDKSVAERLFDPLKHLVRNALDHGIEPPGERLAAGKTAAGRLTLSARQGQGEVVLVVEDDGRGLDFGRIREIAIQRGVLAPDAPASDAALVEALFTPGFTTSAEVGELSGRGIGLDVVRRNVLELGGELHVAGGPGRGCRVSLTVPMTVAVLEGIVVRCAEEHVVIPVDDVRQLVRPAAGQSARLPDGQEVLRLPDGPVPLVRPGALLGLDVAAPRGGVAVLVGAPAGVVALHVDEVVSHEQIMLKSLPRSLRLSDPILGAAVLGDGRVALVLDVAKVAAGEREIEPISFVSP